MSFLAGFRLLPLSLPEDLPWSPKGLYLGGGEGYRLEIAVAEATSKPTKTQLETAWAHRRQRRAVPLLFIVLHHGKADIAGYTGENPSVWHNLDQANVEQLAQVALNTPDRNTAIRFLRNVLPNIDSPLPWLRNEGLFSTHELQDGVPIRKDWVAASEKGKTVGAKRGRDLLAALGLESKPTQDNGVFILFAKGYNVAVGVLLDDNETAESPSLRFNGLTPAQFAIERAARERLPFVLTVAGGQLRLYPSSHGVGVGQRGRTDTYLQIHLDLLPPEQAGYLWLAFSGEALAPGGSLESLLENSRDFTSSLRDRLRERIYADVVPNLAKAILDARKIKTPTAQDMAETYQMALVVLFRLLFISYAEDQGLLPYRTNAAYRVRSLKQKALELLEVKKVGRVLSAGSDTWDECMRLFHAIDRGNSAWGIPMYDGGLFASLEAESRTGFLLEGLSLPDSAFSEVLSALLLDESEEGVGPIDFRALGVREFGEIYEGLLENDLAVADIDLALDSEGNYRPAKEKEIPVVRKGQGYLHTASGARKSTGSFFTKSFVVDYLLSKALDPSLDEHLQRLNGMDEKEAGAHFFDFRVADIAMGSGHFLVAAVDHIERKFLAYLAGRKIQAVSDEMDRLHASAEAAMESVGLGVEIETGQLLRRQIARRCVYGVDKNPMAVELARLSLWLVSLIPGLPLSLLDYNLVCGNSLVGIATPAEAEDALKLVTKDDQRGMGSLFDQFVDDLFADARAAIERLGAASDADAAELAEAKKARKEALRAMKPTVALLDIAAAARLVPELETKVGEGAASHWVKDRANMPGSQEHKLAQKAFAALSLGHFPIMFPQVFLRERVGFDVIIGNPPWEEATIEEYRFWLRYIPSFRGIPQREQEILKKKLRKARPDLAALFEQEQDEMETLRRALLSGPFPGMGTGDPDLYKGFLWRFWQLLSYGGRIGVVLPRSALAAKGSADWRRAVFEKGIVDDLTMLLNNRQWIFVDVHPQYTIALLTLRKAQPDSSTPLPLRGPFRSLATFQEGVKKDPVSFPVQDVFNWTDTAALPLLPAEESAEVFRALRAHPRLDLVIKGGWRARPYRELDATNDKDKMKFSETQPEGYWPVFKGETFDLWAPDTGTYYAWADPKKIIPYLFEARKQRSNREDSPFSEFPKDQINDENTLACLHPRIAFRHVSRSTDSRTMRVALIPAKVVVTNAAPFFLFSRGDEKDQAFLLGVLSSLPLDWYARRFVEVNMNFFLVNPFPIPRPARSEPLWKRTVALAGRLAAPDKRFKAWASAVGVDCGKIAPDEKEDMICELDAVVARLYGLEERHLRHIFETFHEGWDCQERLERVLEHYRRWGKASA